MGFFRYGCRIAPGVSRSVSWYLLGWHNCFHLQCGYLILLLLHFIAKEKAIRAREMSVQPTVDTDPAGVIMKSCRIALRSGCSVVC